MVGTIRLTYFRDLFSRPDLGRGGSINLVRRDGTAVMRVPYDPSVIGRDLSGSPVFRHLLTAPSGTFDGSSTVDGVRRIISFSPVGDLPLVLTVFV